MWTLAFLFRKVDSGGGEICSEVRAPETGSLEEAIKSTARP